MSNEDKQGSTRKATFKIPVVFKVKAESWEQAEEHVTRLQRYGFESIMEYEPATYKAIKGWKFKKERSDV